MRLSTIGNVRLESFCQTFSATFEDYPDRIHTPYYLRLDLQDLSWVFKNHICIGVKYDGSWWFSQGSSYHPPSRERSWGKIGYAKVRWDRFLRDP
jgi:hypothetical protein